MAASVDVISVVCVYNKPDVLDRLLIRGLDRQTIPHERILLDNRGGQFPSCAAALNEGGRRARGRILIFAHQDVELLEADAFERIVDWIDALPDLGIAGIVGAADVDAPPNERLVHRIHQGSPPDDFLTTGRPITQPTPVQTLDELMLIIPTAIFRRSNFDAETCDAWDLYGVDYSLSVAADGLRTYVLPLSVRHGSPGHLSDNFYRVLLKVRRKHRLPFISTTINRWSRWYPLTAFRAARRGWRAIRDRK